MLKLVILLLVLIFILGLLNEKFNWFDSFDFFLATSIPSTIFLLVGLSAGFILINDTIDLNSIDKEITIIEQQNEKINEEVKNSVTLYMEYEGGTYSSLKQDLDSVSIVVLTQQFPELKANELVNTNINIYVENENKLTKLKVSKAKKQAFVDFWW